MNELFCFILYKFNTDGDEPRKVLFIQNINTIYSLLSPSISEKLTQALKNYVLKYNENPLNDFDILTIKSSSFRVNDIITFCVLKKETETLTRITHETAINDFINDINDYVIYHSFSTFLNKIKASMSQRIQINDSTKELRDVFVNPIVNIKEYLLTILIKHSKQELYATLKNKNTETFIKNYFNTYIDTTYKLRNLDLEISVYENKHNLILTDKQKDIIKYILTHKISIIQGNAGTGKSFILKVVYSLLQKKKERSNVFICISTKAKQVLSNYIFNKPNDVNCLSVSKFLSNDVDVDNLFIDEASMIGNSHLKNILYKTRKRIILIGDKKQILPVLTNGIPFSNLQNHYKYLELAELRRQNDLQTISVLNDYITKKETTLPKYEGQTKGIFFNYIDKDSDFVDFYMKFTNAMSIKPAKFEAINRLIQTRIQNGNKAYTLYDKTFYINDRLVRISNRKTPTCEYSNGSFGMLKSYSSGIFKILYDTGEMEEVDLYQLANDFILGYCSSAHKLQGSQYNIVLVYINNCYNLNTIGGKNLLYTAMTRSKDLTIICGSSTAIYDIKQTDDFFNPIDDYL